MGGTSPRPFGIEAYAILLGASGIGELSGGVLWLLGRAGNLVLGSGPGSLWADVESIGIAGIVVGALFIAVAYGVWNGKRLAWYYLFATTALGTALPLVLLVVSLVPGVPRPSIFWALEFSVSFAQLLFLWRPSVRRYLGEFSWATVPASSRPPSGVSRRRILTRNRAAKVCALILLVYGSLFITGAYAHTYVLSSQRSLTDAVVRQVNATGYCSNLAGGNCTAYSGYESAGLATLRTEAGKPAFKLSFLLFWPEADVGTFQGYEGQVEFSGHFAECPSPGLLVGSASVTYIPLTGWHGSQAEVPATVFTLLPETYIPSNYASVSSTAPYNPYSNLHPSASGYQSFEISYSNPQPGACSNSQYFGFETAIGYSVDSYISYSYSIQLAVTLFDTNSSAAPFIGQTYTGSLTIPIQVWNNGTVSLTAAAPGAN